MSSATAGLIALLILAAVAVILSTLVRMNETGHGSRVRDLKEIVDCWHAARSSGEKVLILLWYLRALLRAGYFGACASMFGALAAAAVAIFGAPAWELVRQMLCDVLRFLETLMTSKATACEPAARR